MMNLTQIMNGYFNDERGNLMLNENTNAPTGSRTMPIMVSKSKWSIDDKIMSRIYEFESKEKSLFFAKQVFEYVQDSEHNIEIRFKRDKCTIIIRALSPYITDLEKDVADYFDEIYKDSKYLKLDYNEEF
jgi:hypothetical protein